MRPDSTIRLPVTYRRDDDGGGPGPLSGVRKSLVDGCCGRTALAALDDIKQEIEAGSGVLRDSRLVQRSHAVEAQILNELMQVEPTAVAHGAGTSRSGLCRRPNGVGGRQHVSSGCGQKTIVGRREHRGTGGDAGRKVDCVVPR